MGREAAKISGTKKVNSKKKQDKYLVYNSQHSFTKFKNINEFKELSLGSMYRKLNEFLKNVNKYKTVNHKQMKIE